MASKRSIHQHQTTITTPVDSFNSYREGAYNYNSDTSERSRNSGQDCVGGGCLGGWISSMLGGSGGSGGSGGGSDPLMSMGGGGGGGGGGEGLLHNNSLPTVTQATATTTTSTTTTVSPPQSDDDPTLLVAEELNKLTLKEREVVYEDLHGVSMMDDTELNQELVNQRLMEMKVELDMKIPRSKKVAYLIAMEEFGNVGKEFCSDPSLLFMFLRADRWNSQKAAIRFIGWLDWKLKLFGKDVLCHRHITLDKLEKESQDTIQSGITQIVPQRDTSGRTIIFDSMGGPQKYETSILAMLQQFWYMMMATVEDDVQSQRLGIVCILYSMFTSLSFTAKDRQVMYEASCLVPNLPIRICSFHYCLNDPTIGPIISMIQKAIGSNISVRFRSHIGKHTEVQYSLMTYGIPVHLLPVTSSGSTIKKKNHLLWYQRRQIRDNALSNCIGSSNSSTSSSSSNTNTNDSIFIFNGIDLPGRYDILLGKGKTIQNHLGNRRLQELISIYFQDYDTALYGDKQFIAEELLIRLVPNQFHNQNNQNLTTTTGSSGHYHGHGHVIEDEDHHIITRAGSPRFLKRRTDGWWIPVTHKEAMEKICHAFRAYRFANSKTITSSTSTELEGGGRTGSLASSSFDGGSNNTIIANTKRIKVET